MKALILISVLLIHINLFSTIINVPADQPTIQLGIDISADADTVLVQPGTYIENINYNGKNITVASLFLTTQDTTYISQTIIDGNATGSVVTFTSGEDSSAVLTGFTITNGSASRGGGIYCDHSNPNLVNLRITNNFATDGGGIYCVCSSPSFVNVIITGNSAADGGGIYFESSNSVIENVIISDNTSTHGGGIYSFISELSFLNVSITGNSVGISWIMAQGGGAYLCGGSQTFNNVNISGNSAIDEYELSAYGGGIYCNGNNLILENVTICGNSADNGCGIYNSNNSSNMSVINSILWNSIYFGSGLVTMTYSDVLGGWTGIGNIDENPLFVDSQIGNYHLTENSPCIDAGDPNYPLDPDNTICDMGAFYYHQDQYIVVEEIYPEPGAITISEGDSINFYITASDPDGNPIEYIWELDSEIVSTDSSYTFHTDENSAGTYAVTIDITDNYQPPSRNTLNFEWEVVVEDVVSIEELLPKLTAIYQNYPNPFNPVTKIKFDLSQLTEVQLDIYNIKGQKVKQLVSDQLSAGQHSIIWNGTDQNNQPVSSGIYLYKLKTTDFEKTKKMILMK